MRESNYTFPPSNRAVISINQMLYDRRALDTNSTLALLNNLCQLTYLTSTSPRIREVLTMDGGLERMLDILRDSCLPREPTMPDLWGLNGPCTARTINVDRAISLRHSLAFQCVVNIGVRGNEAIRTRVVQAGALDIVAQILESWLKKNGIAVFSSSLGSQAAVDALAAGIPLPGVERRRRQQSSRHHHSREGGQSQNQQSQTQAQPPRTNSDPTSQAVSIPAPPASRNAATANAQTSGANITPPTTRGLGQLVATLLTNRLQSRPDQGGRVPPPGSSVDTDVEMADGETETDNGDTDTGADGGMDIEDDGVMEPEATVMGPGPSQQTITPRARLPLLPLQIPPRSPETGDQASASSAAASLSDEPTAIPRARSDNSLAMTNVAAAAESGRPASGMAARPIPQLAEAVSTQSSPMGTPLHTVEHVEGLRGRRGTVVGRPLLLPRDTTRRVDESEASDGAPEPDLAQATITAGIAAAAANAAMEAAAAVPNQPFNRNQPAIVNEAAPEEPDPEVLAAEQTRFDMEAGAPPGQPGAAQTPRVAATDVPLPATTTTDLAVPVPPVPPAQIIIANGAPRGFQDLASYVGVSMLLNPEGTNYSEDNILLALQLLAYLSKYPHVRSTFHHPRRPMHRTFDLGSDDTDAPLPQRPAYSETPNIFSLVERFTFRPSPSDPLMYRIPNEIQYWAGVIMRNACRKDDAQGGIRQCAYMSCGRWEVYPREFAKCRRCRKAKYCSKDCQSKAWSEGHRFWCSIRSEPEPSADAANTNDANSGGGSGGSGGGGGDAGGGGGGGRRDQQRHPPADDGDVDMDEAGGGGGGVQATPRAPGRSHATAVPAGAMLPTFSIDGRGATHAPSTAPRAAPAFTPEDSSPPPASEGRMPSRSAPPAFLKLGMSGGPSSTAAMNVAMGSSRRT